MNNALTTLILTPEDVQYIIQHIGADQLMDQLIAQLEQAFRGFDPKQTATPTRSGFNYERPFPGLIEWMPLYQAKDQVIIKVVGYHPENPARFSLPTIVSTISAYDSNNGHLIGLADGVLLTALRTGAASAVATQYLARPDSEILGLIGCGAQAITQVHALSRVLQLREIQFYDADAATMANFQERCEALELACTYRPGSLASIVEQADVLCTATSIDVGEGPLFEGLSTQPHLHINAVGSDFPGKTELPKSLLERSFICADFIDQALKEGECQQLDRASINTDIIALLKDQGDKTKMQQQRTVFDSTGWALEDQIVMDLFMEHAHQLGRGQAIAIETLQEDAKNPYHFLSEISVKI